MRRSAALVAAVVVVLSCATACGDDYVSLRAGECLPASAEVVGTREPDPPTVSCATAHRYEVYGVGRLSGTATFPGEAVVDPAARQVCYALFESGVGFPPTEKPTGTKVVYLAPTESSWNDDHDREVECLLVFDKDHVGRLGRPTSA
ncbi:MAG: septum formation family protein [Acidimicrobiales bacterium]